MPLRQPLATQDHLAPFRFRSELSCRVHRVHADAEQQGPEELLQGRDDAGIRRLVFGGAVRRDPRKRIGLRLSFVMDCGCRFGGAVCNHGMGGYP